MSNGWVNGNSCPSARTNLVSNPVSEFGRIIISQFSALIASLSFTKFMPSIFKRFKPEESPKRYVYIDPDTNRSFGIDTPVTSQTELINLITQYRANNALEPILNLKSVLENFLCGMPENAGKCVNYTLKRNLQAYIKGGIALVKDMLYGPEARVTQEVAENRAEICKKCPFNVIPPEKSWFIQSTDEAVKTYLGDNISTKNDAFLGNCQVCSCVLPFKVHVKGPFELNQGEINQMSTVGCWQLKEAIPPKIDEKEVKNG